MSSETARGVHLIEETFRMAINSQEVVHRTYQRQVNDGQLLANVVLQNL